MPKLDPEVLDELKGVVKEVCADSIAKSAEENKKSLESWKEEFSKKSITEQSELKAKIEAIEKLPLVKRAIAIPGGEGEVGEQYLGHKVAYQFSEIIKGRYCAGAKNLVVESKYFPVIADEEKRLGMAKHMLMIIKASCGDFRAQKDYSEWREKFQNANKTALNEGTGSQGGYLVPTEYSNEIIMFASLVSVVLQKARIWPMSTSVRHVPAELARVSVTEVAETTATGASDPTFADVVLTAKKVTAYTTASNELLEDGEIDIVGYLTEIFAEAVGQEVDNQAFNGTGDPVSGLLTGAAGFSVVLGSGSTAFSALLADDLLSMIDKIPQQAELGAEFFFNKNILTYIRKFKDTTNQYLFAMNNGNPVDLFSYPYNRVPKMPAASASGTGKGFAVFGNLKYFNIGMRRNAMTLMVDPYGKFLEGQTRFKIEPRIAWAIGLANAFCRVVTA